MLDTQCDITAWDTTALLVTHKYSHRICNPSCVSILSGCALFNISQRADSSRGDSFIKQHPRDRREAGRLRFRLTVTECIHCGRADMIRWCNFKLPDCSRLRCWQTLILTLWWLLMMRGRLAIKLLYSAWLTSRFACNRRVRQIWVIWKRDRTVDEWPFEMPMASHIRRKFTSW